MAARRGFTLLEMAVSAAVVAVLVGLLLPALARARASHRRAGCMVHLRTMGQALEMHRGANDGVLPFADRPADARLGDAAPFDALARRMDLPGEGAFEFGAAPFVCPAAARMTSDAGVDYWYTPQDLMRLWPRPMAARAVTAWLARDPTVVLLHDDAARHAGRAEGTPLSGMNALRMDGGVQAGGSGASVNPRR
jgi:prepilin-type N-terminal cleavage/methylation domain-containing protein